MAKLVTGLVKSQSDEQRGGRRGGSESWESYFPRIARPLKD